MAAADQVEVVFASFASEFGAAPGDRLWVDADKVQALVSGGIAAPATVTDAKEAGVDVSEAATKKAKA